MLRCWRAYSDLARALTATQVLPFLSWLSPRCWPPRLKGTDIALEGRYAIMRNERMVIISIGNICLNATKEAFQNLPAFDWHGVAMCAATPWAAFLIKVLHLLNSARPLARNLTLTPTPTPTFTFTAGLLL